MDTKNIMIVGVGGQDVYKRQAEKLGMPVHSGKKLDEAVPARPPVMCAGCPHRGLFYTLKKNKLTVLGDIGCYTLGAAAPLAAIDTTICMGASVSGLHGFNKASGEKNAANTVAVIGDSTFMHSGVTGPVSYTHLDVYKRQRKYQTPDACRADPCLPPRDWRSCRRPSNSPQSGRHTICDPHSEWRG